MHGVSRVATCKQIARLTPVDTNIRNLQSGKQGTIEADDYLHLLPDYYLSRCGKGFLSL